MYGAQCRPAARKPAGPACYMPEPDRRFGGGGLKKGGHRKVRT
jgi:hypothetical protein